MPEGKALQESVEQLTEVVRQLHKLLERDYPRRAEVERRFVSKQKYRLRLALVAALTVAGCYAVTVGSYSMCFVGDLDNPRFCTLVPGYDERVDRNQEVDQLHTELESRIAKLEKQVSRQSRSE